MAQWLKHGATAEVIKSAAREVRETVEATLADIEARGDAAIRDLSIRFDKLDREDYRLTQKEIDDCLSQLSARDIKDIEFAQTQVRNFARHQRDSIKDIEVETLPGVILGHRNIPVNAAGCYVPGGKYPLLASAHMSVITAQVAGVPRIITCAPPFQGKPAPAIVAAQHMAGAHEILLSRRHSGGRRDGNRHGEHRARRHAGRAGQRVRRGSEAPVVRARGHRPVRGSDRDARDRR
ncbi:histidinol dehydrogenase [Caballeronia calidae]|uniref:Histidinol dehydrogenase n=1 Tax=Caballeronia calidae TaxID=1777139 RepID=A0A158A2Q2_9BURK|nr:histidinol dehydrogenase [Caballeronia calidae]